MKVLVAIAVLVVITLSVISGGSHLQKRKFSRVARSLVYYENTFLRKQGWTQEFGQYELLSFDGGKRWYAVERGEDDGSVIIRGTVDEVFPRLLTHLHGMDALIAYIEQNGPVTLSGARAGTDSALLEAAGFTVTETK